MTKLPLVLLTVALTVSCAGSLRASVQAQALTPSRQPSRDEGRGAGEEGGEKAEARFAGLRNVAERDLWWALRDEHVGVAKSFEYDPAKVGHAVRVVKEFLAKRGYLHAAVDAREENFESGAKLLTFVVDEGERARVAEIRFEGSRAVPASHLSEKVKRCLARSSAPDAYDAELLEYCLHAARSVFLAEGYLQAKFGAPSKEETERGLVVTVPTQEGVRYRVGKIRVKGATVFSPEQIVEMLDLKAGDIAAQDKITETFERLIAEYEDRGYVQFASDIEPTYGKVKKGADEGVVDFDLEIYEGKPFAVNVRFEGNRLKTEKELRSALSINDGELFSRRKFLDGLENLRRLGVFKGFFKGSLGNNTSSGVLLGYNEEKGTVSIGITIDEGDGLEDSSARAGEETPDKL